MAKKNRNSVLFSGQRDAAFADQRHFFDNIAQSGADSVKVTIRAYQLFIHVKRTVDFDLYCVLALARLAVCLCDIGPRKGRVACHHEPSVYKCCLNAVHDIATCRRTETVAKNYIRAPHA